MLSQVAIVLSLAALNSDNPSAGVAGIVRGNRITEISKALLAFLHISTAFAVGAALVCLLVKCTDC